MKPPDAHEGIVTTLLTYNFMVLGLLFLIPGTVIYALRPDLRSVIHTMSLCALPFALTERLFYPSYWSPTFLFDLVNIIGFGIEDILFVVGLAAFTSTAYPFFAQKRYITLHRTTPRDLLTRAAALLAVILVLVALVALVKIPMIYGSFAIMLATSGLMVATRRDLLLPALLGGLFSVSVYWALCLLFAWTIPGIFDLAWHTEKFINIFVLGVPVEELMYGFAAGVASTVFYPVLMKQGFVPLKSPHDSTE